MGFMCTSDSELAEILWRKAVPRFAFNPTSTELNGFHRKGDKESIVHQ